MPRLELPGLELPGPVVEAMRAELSQVAERTVAAVIREVPSYSEPFRGRMGRNIESAVVIALGGFLDLVSTTATGGRSSRVESVFEAAYALGRGEARSGRTMDALASAYRVGARTAWRDMSSIAVDNDLPAGLLARFAELVFEYIDQISAVSVSGHADELATTGRVRERHLERLAAGILEGAGPEVLTTYAERAEWTPPRTLTAVLLPSSSVGSVRTHLDARTLQSSGDLPGLAEAEGVAVLLVPDVTARGRRTLIRTLIRALGDRDAVVGPTRPWVQARTSYHRAVRVRALTSSAGGPVDSEEHLGLLVLGADPVALADLQARVLAPLARLRPASAEKLRATLRAWLLHHGRREEIAAALFVHPQTVRYRMGQLRELYGDRLEDPQTVLELTIALGLPPSGADATSLPDPPAGPMMAR